MSQLIIPVGIPGCGKSTWAKTFFGREIDRIWSTDEIRALPEFGGDVNNQERNNEVFDFFHRSIREDLENGIRVVADATNLTAKARRTLYEVAYETKSECHVVLFKNTTVAVCRNKLRERVVPENAMMRMLYNYEDALIRLPGEQRRRLFSTLTSIGAF